MPDGWEPSRLDQCLADEFPGEWGSAPNGNANATVLRSTDIDDEGHVDLSSGARRLIPPSKLATKRLRVGDILLETSGGGPGKPVGRVALFRGNDDSVYLCSNFFRTLRPDLSRVNAPFLAWLLKHLYEDPHIWAFQQQTTGIINLKFRDYAAVELSLPPLSEQRLIAQILDTIDEAIRKTEQLIAKLKQVKQGLLHDLLTRGIDENGELRDPERHPEQFKDSPFGWIPAGWHLVNVGKTASLITKGTTPTTYGYKYRSSGSPFLRVENLTEEGTLDLSGVLFIDDATNSFLARSQLRPGDLLISIAGTIGRTAVVPPGLTWANCNQAVALVRFRRDAVRPRFAREFLASPTGQRGMSGYAVQLAQANLSLGQISATRLPQPDLEEQDRITDAIDRCHETLEMEAAALHKLRLLKTALANDLLTGRVRVTPLLPPE